jgi:hypothetical protein
MGYVVQIAYVWRSYYSKLLCMQLYKLDYACNYSQSISVTSLDLIYAI